MKQNNLEKKYLEISRMSVRFLVVSAILSVTIFLLLLDSVKLYRSTVLVMVVPKSQIAIEQKSDIVQNVREFPKMLSFYDRLLNENPQIKDAAAGYPQDKRKKVWNEFIQTKQADTKADNVVEISLIAKTQADAEFLSKKTTQALFGVMSRYYNLKSDVSVQIVDGPITTAIVRGWFWLLTLSLVLGMGLAFLFKQLLAFAQKTVRSNKQALDMVNLAGLGERWFKQKEQNLNSLEDLYLSEEKAEVLKEQIFKKEAQSELEKQTVSKPIFKEANAQYPNFPEMPKMHVPKASAPDNLPIAASDDFYQETIIEPKEVFAQEEEKIMQKEPQHHEPTQEELKRRLNQLLNGGF